MDTKQNWNDNDLFSLIYPDSAENGVSLPYNGSSGHSGTETSKNRADHADSNGLTAERQAFVYRYLLWQQEHGSTWKEISEQSGWHHGVISGALSAMHKEGRISRLLETRDRCRVYVLNEYVSGRETDSQGRKPKECPNCGYHL